MHKKFLQASAPMVNSSLASSAVGKSLVEGQWQGIIRRGGGVWDPRVCAPKMARSDFPVVIFVFSGDGQFGLSSCRVRAF